MAQANELVRERHLGSKTVDAGGRRSGNPTASWLVLAVPVLAVLAGAWAYRWVQEDAFIDFRIVGNLLAGHGPVFNVGERVEADSDPLWVFTLAAVHGLLPFVSLEWLSVVLGLLGTSSGFVLAGRAVQRLGASRDEGLILPIGLLLCSAVAAVWEFATSGLEMGMVFCWIGLAYWLLVRTEQRRSSGLWCAFVIGLGPLIRPELLLMSLVLLVALGIVVGAPGWRGPASLTRRFGLPLLAAAGLPFLYELWRMAYYGLLVPNTGLAKSGTGSWWSQGFTYLWNFVAPYTLWLPLLLAIPLVVPRLRRWWSAGDRVGMILLVTPAVAALADWLYVVRVGGDHMHARLLLPGFFALCLGIYVEARQLRSLLLLSVIGIMVWCVASAGWLRWDSGTLAGQVYGTVHGIANERNIWVAETGTQHPITAADWRRYGLPGDQYRAAASWLAVQGRQAMLVITNPLRVDLKAGNLRPARSPLPFHLAVNLTNVGFIALESGPDVYIFDRLSLANPIGSHTTEGGQRQLGGKVIGPAWMVARFGHPGEHYPAGAPSAASVAAARRALQCAPLKSYLHAITAPLTLGQAFSNIVHATTYTTMSFSPDPTIAYQQLCHPKRKGST
jgi:arabinofuranosyltransferase